MKAILFDLDETLLNRERSLLNFIRDQYDRLFAEYDVNKEEFCSKFMEWDQRGYVWKDVVYEQIIKFFSLDHFCTEELVRDYVLNFASHAAAFPGLHHVLSTLKREGYYLGLITNGRVDLQTSTIEALKIAPFFDIILISESFGIKKPDPRIFKHALNQLGVEPSSAVYVGDHPINDVKAAKQCGMKGIWRKTAHWDGEGIQYEIEELPDLLELIKNIK
ncbi:HAD family hydrolase [Bacillus sp. Marseille-Q1617]|uniref:HAD family hydrolase n=1 Tax=Bacillus sp. Marseille-Q1617 TaxID=2736887 RepID=UPI0015892965|nr:HAD family hydrolase [Bacillus sp. Marseille-Q1617]